MFLSVLKSHSENRRKIFPFDCETFFTSLENFSKLSIEKSRNFTWESLNDDRLGPSNEQILISPATQWQIADENLWLREETIYSRPFDCNLWRVFFSFSNNKFCLRKGNFIRRRSTNLQITLFFSSFSFRDLGERSNVPRLTVNKLKVRLSQRKKVLSLFRSRLPCVLVPRERRRELLFWNEHSRWEEENIIKICIKIEEKLNETARRSQKYLDDFRSRFSCGSAVGV